MQVEHDYFEWIAAFQAPLPQHDADTVLVPRGPAADVSQPGAHVLAPPRLTPMTIPALPRGRRTLAELNFPADLVRARAADYAREACAAGARHSLRLWREGCEHALLSLARAATALPASAQCDSLAWQLEREMYHVSIAFSVPVPPVLH